MAKRKKKNLNSYTLLFILIIVTTISTWIIPAGKYKIIDGKYLPGTYQRIESNPQGIIDISSGSRFSFSMGLPPEK